MRQKNAASPRSKSLISPEEPIFSPESSSVVELVGRATRGDRAAFRQLFESHVAMVRRVARELGERDGDDLVQETFVKAWQHLGSLKTPGLFGPWVTTIARRVVFARHRGQKVADLAVARLAEEVASQTEALQVTESVATVVVRELLEALPEGPERATVVGFYIDGRSVADLMAAQQSAKGTITARLSRFRVRVKRRLAARLLAAGETGHTLEES